MICDFQMVIEELKRRRDAIDSAIRTIMELTNTRGEGPPGAAEPDPPAPSLPGSPKPTLRYPIKPGKFRGVVPVTSLRAGMPVRFRASYWDGEKKKNLGLGTFADELEAAMAVAKKTNNTEDIERITELMKARGRSEPTQSTSTKTPVAEVWECNKCGRQHLATQRPAVCEQCGKDHGFRKIA